MKDELIPPMYPFTDKDFRITRPWFIFLQKQFNMIQSATAMQSQQQEVPVMFDTNSDEGSDYLFIPGIPGAPGAAAPPSAPVVFDWGSDPETDAQPVSVLVGPSTPTSAAAAFIAGTGTAVTIDSTYDGYTIGQVVRALRNNRQLT